jgi:hypothetical protein
LFHLILFHDKAAPGDALLHRALGDCFDFDPATSIRGGQNVVQAQWLPELIVRGREKEIVVAFSACSCIRALYSVRVSSIICMPVVSI